MSSIVQNWLGDDASLNQYLLHLARGRDEAAIKACSDDYSGPENPVTVDQMGNIAVIKISGGMISEPSRWSRYDGIVSYPDIQERMEEVGEDQNTEAVMLRWNSGGGDAQGVAAFAKYIRTYNNEVKPVVSYVSGNALSAAYWLASGASKILADEESFLGSIGCTSVHIEITEMLKQMGVNAKVYRSAPYKALGHPMEKRTPEADAEMTRRNKLYHDRFVNGISELRGIDVKTLNERIANGKVYETKEAVTFGMLDGVLSFELALARIHAGLKSSQNPTKK